MEPYPRPGETGGTLIRKVLSLFKSQGVKTPLQGSILIAVSGGVDSMVLAHLLCRYGRNLIKKEDITLLHFDHGWRPESADEERDAVCKFAHTLGVGFKHERLDSPHQTRLSSNLEEDGRLKRVAAYEAFAGGERSYRHVLTAHHQDDVAETVLWRFLRGEGRVGEVGILFSDTPCLRPFLEVSKEEIRNYAREENVPFFEDPTNLDARQFRAWVRQEVFPVLERFYPSVRETLAGYAHHRHPSSEGRDRVPHDLVNLLEAITQGPLNRTQRATLQRMLDEAAVGQALTLAKGVQLKRLKTGWFIENSNHDNQA